MSANEIKESGFLGGQVLAVRNAAEGGLFSLVLRWQDFSGVKSELDDGFRGVVRKAGSEGREGSSESLCIETCCVNVSFVFLFLWFVGLEGWGSK